VRQALAGYVWLLPWLVVLGTALDGRAGVPRTEPPLAQRVALADCVAVGKVTALEEQTVDAFPLLKVRGAKKVPYRIALVTIQSLIVGPKDLPEVRVGFLLPPEPGRVVPPGYRRMAQVNLTVNQEGCFFLRKHPEEPFYVAQASYDFLDKAKSKDFDQLATQVRRHARLLENPDAGLRSKEADDRLATAATLIFRYRSPVYVYTRSPKTEPIDAGQSRLILAALAESPWTEKDAESQTGRLRLFLRLGLTEADGWTQPASPKDTPAAALKWLRENGATYRIQRYIPENKTSDTE